MGSEMCIRDSVYIKPLENAEDWLNGISVLVEHLIPVRIGDRVFHDSQKLERQRHKYENDCSQ